MGGHLSHLRHEPMHDTFNASCGPMEGNIYRHGDREVVGFVNIPYAKAPIGDLRFKKPEPREVWTEAKYCHLPGPISPQTGGLGQFAERREPEWSEDCLHLSVFGPRNRSNGYPDGFPVMVFLHGGGYEFSSSIDYDPYSISGTLPLKDIVVVTVNYRLGVLGFFTTGDDVCRGNFGLWDQTLALKWVQKHISCFGGNPRNVTVFGQSAGGASTDFLSLSPHSRDLFHKMILMSGTSHCEFAMRTSEDQADVFREFAVHHGYEGNNSKSLLDWYQKQPAEVLVDVEKFDRSNSGWLNFIVNLDGDFLPKPLAELRKEAPVKPVMLGVCEFEGLILGVKGNDSSESKDVLRKLLSNLFREDVDSDPEITQNKILSYYTSRAADEEELRKRKMLFIGDYLFNVGVQMTAEAAAKTGNPVFLYSFEYCNPKNFGVFENLLPFKAATHFTDIRYVLGEGLYSEFKPDEEDLKMMDVMTSIYSNFSKFGDPNGEEHIGWERFSAATPEKHFRIAIPKSEMRDVWQDGRCRLMFVFFLFSQLPLIHGMSGFLSHLKPIRSDQVLNASCGPVKGNIYRHNEKTVHGYLGIPYAQPPVGRLRFQKPEEAVVWKEPRQCYQYGPGCPQSGKYANMLSGRMEFAENNCLTLNVFSSNPAFSQKLKMPVMVYIHGGGFETGSSASFNDFSISGSLPLKDVVLVTINYRLGPLGFLTTGSTSCRGNFGLWDQTLALKWVQKHISSFGGDPLNVTVFGTSAGGASADLLALSPHSRDLFHRYIAMSATGISDLVIRTNETQLRVFEEFARHHGYDGSDPEALFQWYDGQPLEKFAEVSDFSQPASGFLYFLPTLDGDFFPKPFDVLRKEGGKKDIILTVGEFEGLGMIGANPGWVNKTPDIGKAIDHAFGEDVVRNPEEARRLLLNHYTNGVAENDTEALTLKLVEFLGDSWFNLPALLTAKSASEHGSNVYLASFVYFNPKDVPAKVSESLPFLAATHGTDLQFVLGDGAFMPFRPDRNDLKFMDFVTTMYSDFAKSGNPSGNRTELWQKFDLRYPERYFKVDHPKSEMTDGFQNGRLPVLEEIVTKEKKYREIVLGN